MEIPNMVHFPKMQFIQLIYQKHIRDDVAAELVTLSRLDLLPTNRSPPNLSWNYFFPLGWSLRKNSFPTPCASVSTFSPQTWTMFLVNVKII